MSRNIPKFSTHHGVEVGPDYVSPRTGEACLTVQRWQYEVGGQARYAPTRAKAAQAINELRRLWLEGGPTQDNALRMALQRQWGRNAAFTEVERAWAESEGRRLRDEIRKRYLRKLGESAPELRVLLTCLVGLVADGTAHEDHEIVAASRALLARTEPPDLSLLREGGAK